MTFRSRASRRSPSHLCRPMRALPSAQELLEAWTLAAPASADDAGAALLRATGGRSSEELAGAPVGVHDAALLELRSVLFGFAAAAVATCPGCAGELEMALDIRELLVRAPTLPRELFLEQAGHRVLFRLPTVADLAAVASCPDAAAAELALLHRCILRLEGDGSELPPRALPADLGAVVVEAMAAADPQADLRLALACPTCGHDWEARFDIASFLWAEVDAWAHRTLGEVHVLASGYGWSERAILALSPARRQLYADVLRA
jgi:hypothetical protein